MCKKIEGLNFKGLNVTFNVCVEGGRGWYAYVVFSLSCLPYIGKVIQ